MEKEVFIDFSIIDNDDDFYNQLEEKLNLPDYFGRNLDALFDVISGDLEMPLHLEFVNMTLMQLETFEALLETMEDLQEENEEFSFSYFLEIYEGGDDWDDLWETDEDEFEEE